MAKHPQLFNGRDQAFQLCEALEGFQSHYFKEAQTLEDGTQHGNAIISKFAMQEKSFCKLTLLPDKDDASHRVVLRTTFERPEGKFDFYNAHFSWVEEQAA